MDGGTNGGIACAEAGTNDPGTPTSALVTAAPSRNGENPSRSRELLASVKELPSNDAFVAEARRAKPSDIATIIYTSGTTGEPKGVMLTHNNLFSNVQAGLMTAVDVGPDDIALSFLPLSHVFQRMVDYAMFRAGAALAYVPAIDRVMPAMAAVRPTFAVAVPRVYEKIYTAMLSGPENMPVFGDNQLTPEEKRAITRYVRYLTQEADNPGGAGLGRYGPISEGLVAWVVGLTALVGLTLWIGARA